MSENLSELTEVVNNINQKIKLLSLIVKAKKEYDSFDFTTAKVTLLEAINVDENNATVLRGLGCLYQFEKDYEKAVEYYKKALNFSIAKEVEYTLIGLVYYFQEKFDKSVEYFNLAILENDDYDKAYEGKNQAILENHLKLLDLQDSLKKYF